MDDGWFGERNDDAHSLGDWEANEKKLPGGLAGLGRKIKALGLDFGIWVEPEMVNVNSHLYQAHPDWTIEIPGNRMRKAAISASWILREQKCRTILLRR